MVVFDDSAGVTASRCSFIVKFEVEGRNSLNLPSIFEEFLFISLTDDNQQRLVRPLAVIKGQRKHTFSINCAIFNKVCNRMIHLWLLSHFEPIIHIISHRLLVMHFLPLSKNL